MIDQPLRVSTKSGLQVLGRIYGNELRNTVLIFCHGFGVKSDSRGMFNVLCETFGNDFLTVRFHFVTIDDFAGDTYVTGYLDQLEKLQTVITRINEKFPGKQVILVAHSQGCLISSMYIDSASVLPALHVMMAPPVAENLAERKRIQIAEREGGTLNEQGNSYYPRTDGTKTVILSSFWQDASEIKPFPLYQRAVTKVPTVIIWAKNDTSVPLGSYEKIRQLSVNAVYELPNSHDFMEDTQAGVVDVLKKELTRADFLRKV